jgi:micrococcal nuclease
VDQTVDTLQPTFRWEPVAEPDARYDFVIYDSYAPPSIGPRGKVYYRQGLQEPEHTLEVSLQPDRKYYWSVRMRREEEVSEWSRFDYLKIRMGGCGAPFKSTLEYPWFFFQTPVASQADSTTVQVARVIDGDTIQVCCIFGDRVTVRYIGIDTPETHHPMKGVEFFGKEASEANRILVDGKTIRLEFDVQQLDKYDRTLAYVYLEDGTFVNAWLVENGYAMVMTVPPNVKHQELFLKLQQEAREAGRGLWK